MERMRRGFTLVRKSWTVLRADPELIGLAFVGTVLWVGVLFLPALAVFAVMAALSVRSLRRVPAT